MASVNILKIVLVNQHNLLKHLILHTLNYDTMKQQYCVYMICISPPDYNKTYKYIVFPPPST